MAGSTPSTALSGLAHVATLAFVGARAVPGPGYGIALVGGTAIAHGTRELGLRRGVAAGTAAAIESVAIMGPARMSGPGGQLITAPVIGWLAARGSSFLSRLFAAATVRFVFNLITTAIFIAVIAGGVDNYAGTYDATFGQIPGAPEGTAAALIGTAISLVIWALGASWAQVAVIQRAENRWTETGRLPLRKRATDSGAGAAAAPEPAARPRRRFDPRAVVGASVISFAVLLSGTEPYLLAGMAAWLAIVWQLAPAEREVVLPGLLLAATIGLSSLAINWIGSGSAEEGLTHGTRAALLVMTATWMRGAAGPEGVREVARRVLARFRRMRIARETEGALADLEGDRRMGAALRTLVSDVRSVEGNLSRMLNAAIDWMSEESARFRPSGASASPLLRLRAADLAIAAAALLPPAGFVLA